jgi:hypothetical protein
MPQPLSILKTQVFIVTNKLVIADNRIITLVYVRGGVVGDVLLLVVSQALRVRIRIVKTTRPCLYVIGEEETEWPLVEIAKSMNGFYSCWAVYEY